MSDTDKDKRITELQDALSAMLNTHGAHGPCEQNNCKECCWAYDSAFALLQTKG